MEKIIVTFESISNIEKKTALVNDAVKLVTDDMVDRWGILDKSAVSKAIRDRYESEKEEFDAEIEDELCIAYGALYSARSSDWVENILRIIFEAGRCALGAVKVARSNDYEIVKQCLLNRYDEYKRCCLEEDMKIKFEAFVEIVARFATLQKKF